MGSYTLYKMRDVNTIKRMLPWYQHTITQEGAQPFRTVFTATGVGFEVSVLAAYASMEYVPQKVSLTFDDFTFGLTAAYGGFGVILNGDDGPMILLVNDDLVGPNLSLDQNTFLASGSSGNLDFTATPAYADTDTWLMELVFDLDRDNSGLLRYICELTVFQNGTERLSAAIDLGDTQFLGDLLPAVVTSGNALNYMALGSLNVEFGRP